MSRSAARLATTGVVVTTAMVAVLSGRTDSAFTPTLPEDAQAAGVLQALHSLLGLDGLSHDAAAGVGGLAVAAVVLAFLFALREAWRGNLSMRTVVIVAVALHALALLMPLMFSRDVYSYGMYGRILAAHGANPFAVTPSQFPMEPVFPYVSHHWIATSSFYGPAFVLLAAAVGSMAAAPAAFIPIFKIIAAVASLVTMGLTTAAARRARPERAVFAATLIGWNPVVILHTVGGGHNDPLVALTLAGGALLLLKGRQLAATVVLTLGALVKITALLPLAVAVGAVVVRRPRGERLRALGMHGGAAASLVAVLAGPFMLTAGPTLGMLDLAGVQGWLAPTRLLRVTAIRIGRALGEPELGRLVGAGFRILFPLVLLACLAMIARHLARDPARVHPRLIVAAVGWASLIGLMTAPLLLPWYSYLVLPVAWILPKVPRNAAVALAAALAVTEVVAEPSRAPLAWEAMILGLHYVASPLALVLLILVVRDLRRRTRIGPLPGDADPLLAEFVVSGKEPGGEIAGDRDPDDRPPAQVTDRKRVGAHGAEHDDGRSG